MNKSYIIKVLEYFSLLFLCSIIFSSSSHYLYREYIEVANLIGIFIYPLIPSILIMICSLFLGFVIYGLLIIFKFKPSMYNANMISILLTTAICSFIYYDDTNYDELKEEIDSEIKFMLSSISENEKASKPLSMESFLPQEKDPFLFRYFYNETVRALNSYQSEVDSIGWEKFADFDRIKNDKTFSESNQMYLAVDIAIKNYKKDSSKIYQKVINRINLLDKNERDAVEHCFNKAWEKDEYNRKRILDLESQISTKLFRLVKFLHNKKDQIYRANGTVATHIMYGDGSRFIFESDDDANYYNNEIKELNEQLTNQISIQEETHKIIVDDFYLCIYDYLIKF